MRHLTAKNWLNWPSHKMSPVWADRSPLRSMNEWYVATLLDILDIRWEYEPSALKLEDGTTYTPDFYLPQVGVYIEAKAGTRGTGRTRLRKPAELSLTLARCEESPETRTMYEQYIKVFIMHNGRLCPVRGEVPDLKSEQSFTGFFGQCPSCDTWYPVDIVDTYECRGCGRYFGDHFAATLQVSELTRLGHVSWWDVEAFAHAGPEETGPFTTIISG